MKPSLQLKFSQQLTMTPQLQQAIKLLQLSHLELQQEIQQALETNPLLEVEEKGIEDPSGENLKEEASDKESTTDSLEDLSSEFSQETIDELPIDSSWEELYPTNSPSINSDSEFNQDINQTKEDSLIDHLMWQLNLCHMSEIDQHIASIIIEALDENGYLKTDLEEILKTANNLLWQDPSSADQEIQIESDEILAVLHRIQQFDPPGVAAQNLQECLTIQLKQAKSKPELYEETLHIINNFLELLGSRDYAQILRKTKLKEHSLQQIIQNIQGLNPHPGTSVVSDKTDYVIPDVIVKKKNNQWVAELNQEVLPKLKINQQYTSLLKQSTSKSDNNYLKNNLQEAKWFVKSLKSRNETLLKVSNRIVEIQSGFFEHGEEAMKPLILHDIAELVEMHESTISRVTTQKYMLTPKGLYELKYFFSSHVSTASGGECSSTAIRAIIKKLVSAENPRKPLSDNKISELLKEQNIKVARRTIAKYRESLSIPPSNERKQLV